MARSHRLDFPGARHHVMNRAIAREPIFHTDEDCVQFLEVLAQVPDRFRARIHGYALMPNHYHLMVEVPEGNLSAVMRFVGASFTQGYNRRTGRDGPVFRGRFRNRVVRSDAYWMHLLAYLHLNPVRAHLVQRAEQSLWTSHGAYVGAAVRPDWLTCSELLGMFGSSDAVEAYVDGVRTGARPAPPTFDPERFWRAPETLEEPAAALPVRRTPDEALDDVARVLGVPRDEVLRLKRGRTPNFPAWTAAWWLGRGAGLSQREIGEHLGVSRARAAQIVGKLRRRAADDPTIAAWMDALEAGAGQG